MSLTDKCALSLSVGSSSSSLLASPPPLTAAKHHSHSALDRLLPPDRGLSVLAASPPPACEDDDFELQSAFSSSTDREHLGLAMSLMNPDELTGSAKRSLD